MKPGEMWFYNAKPESRYMIIACGLVKVAYADDWLPSVVYSNAEGMTFTRDQDTFLAKFTKVEAWMRS